MNTTKIIMIRHGQSVGNFERRFLGHTDLDITEIGYKQADRVCEFLKNEHIDVIYSSDLQRAVHTVEPLAKVKNLQIVKDKGLREIFAGDWENVEVDRLYSEFGDDFHFWKNDIGNARCTNGESVLELKERIFKRITEIAKENSGKTVCIGTHATPIRVTRAAVENVSKDDMKNIPWANNASITRLDYNDGKFTLVSYGYDEFLGELKTEFVKNL